jgi:primosomal protein N'
MKFNNEQQQILDSITENPHNLHIFTSTLGSGKTFFVKYITQHFLMHGKNVLLLVTISNTTFCLNAIATTMHIAFCIATHGYLFVPFELHNVIQNLKSTNVIIIDD